VTDRDDRDEWERQRRRSDSHLEGYVFSLKLLAAWMALAWLWQLLRHSNAG
jgi:hypothetical protein